MSGMYTQAPTPGASGKFINSEKLPSPQSGYGRREIPYMWSTPVQGITISESSQPSSVSQFGCSHPLAHYVRKLHSRNLEIAQMYCAIPRLRSLKIGCAISRLARNFEILRLRKFLDCVEHMHWLHTHIV